MEIKSKTLNAVLKIVHIKDKAPRLEFYDPLSGLTLSSVELAPGVLENLILNGQAESKAVVYGVGKQLGRRRLVESRTVPYPGSLADDQQQVQHWVKTTKTEPGWFVDPKVRSGDLVCVGAQVYVTYHVYRFV